LSRGKVECRFNLQTKDSAPRELAINAVLLGQLKNAQLAIQAELPQAAPLSVAEVLRWPGMLADDSPTFDALQPEIVRLVAAALDELVATRRREGEKLAEMIRGGIESVRDSQLESARAIGLTRGQTYRHVIFPQVLRQLLPPLTGQFASIIKDSSLLSIIAVSEFTLNAQEVNAFTYSTLESYLPLAAGYLLLTLPISLASRVLEKRYHYAA
jgi:hypothetical protein